MKKATVHETREFYKGRNFSFVVENITLPNGHTTEHGIVRHPGSTGIVPVLEDGRVVMLRQYRHAVGEYLLEIPAGTLEPGESPLECARRELEEETAFSAEEMISMGTIHILPAYSDEVIHLYLARGLSLATQNLDRDEVLQVVTHTFEELMGFVRDGTITDALTVLSLYKAGTILGRNL